jgi:hypothetical protein
MPHATASIHQTTASTAHSTVTTNQAKAKIPLARGTIHDAKGVSKEAMGELVEAKAKMPEAKATINMERGESATDEHRFTQIKQLHQQNKFTIYFFLHLCSSVFICGNKSAKSA